MPSSGTSSATRVAVVVRRLHVTRELGVPYGGSAYGEQSDRFWMLAPVEFLAHDKPAVAGASIASQHLSPPIS